MRLLRELGDGSKRKEKSFMADLHVHSTYSSDADHSVEDLLRMARRAGIQTIAITDHDSTDGAREALLKAAQHGLRVIPGVEITSFHRGRELHVLGYFIRIDSAALDKALAESRALDEIRIREVIARLNRLEFSVEMQEAQALAPRAVPKCSIVAKALMTNGRNDADPRLVPYRQGPKANQPFHNFFLDFMRHGAVAYVEPPQFFSTERAINLISDAQGLPVLAHVGSSAAGISHVELIKDLKKYGLRGVEVYSPYHTEKLEAELTCLCEETDLLTTAGSDFHGQTVKPGIALGDHRARNAPWLERFLNYAPHA